VALAAKGLPDDDGEKDGYWQITRVGDRALNIDWVKLDRLI